MIVRAVLASLVIGCGGAGLGVHAMIEQDMFVVVSRSGDRFAARQCAYADATLPERCQITVVADDRIVDRVGTYLRERDRDNWPGVNADRAVDRAIDKHFGGERIALQRGAGAWPVDQLDGVAHATADVRVDDGIVAITYNGRILTRAAVPNATAAVHRFWSPQARDLFAVAVTSGSDRSETLVLFRRSGLRDFLVVTVVPVLVAN